MKRCKRLLISFFLSLNNTLWICGFSQEYCVRSAGMNERYYFSVMCCVEPCAHCTKHEWFYSASYCHCSVTHVLQLNHEQFWLPFRLKYKHAAYVISYVTFCFAAENLHWDTLAGLNHKFNFFTWWQLIWKKKCTFFSQVDKVIHLQKSLV